ncbi:MAG: hypothetical protein IT287_01610 [Bdellovibrionaceae bacterium]|nr:hypothetical protein [Pseudobdellovibrionaceae bacterium]
MKKLLFMLIYLVFNSETFAGELYCEFTVYGAPFIETSAPLNEGILGEEVAVTNQGATRFFPLVLENLSVGEKFKFTIADGNPEGEVYVTVFEEAGSVDGSFKSMVSNPAVTIPALKDVLGYCLIQEESLVVVQIPNSKFIF